MSAFRNVAAKASLVIFLLFLSCPLFAQEFRATITGQVIDPSGATVGKAQVQAVNRDTKQVYTTTTTDKGVYFLPYVLPGTYTVTVTVPGFKSQVQDNVLLQASKSTGLNFTLALGTTSETVEVSGAPPLIETANGSGGTVLTERELENVPLNGRQVYTLLGTTPGSQFLQTQFGSSGYSGTRGWDVSNKYTLGGGVKGYQQFTLNGTNITLQNNGNQGTWQIAPNVDALEEVNVMTTTYDARYGRTGGGTVNMVTKSGTNAFHGDAYDYLENGALDANNFENNLNGLPRQNLHQNQFGGTFGGPVKKDKIFFFGSYEQYIENIPFTTVTSVPPAYLRPTSGGGVDFTQSGFTIYDPLTTVCTAPGGTLGNCPGNAYSRTAFPNDTIPANRINAIGAAVLNLYPLPNTASGGLQNNFTANVPDKYRYWQPMVRVDYDTSDKTRWYSMFAFQHGTEFRNSSGFASPAENGNINTMRQELMASQDMTHIFSSTLLADFKLSFSRFLDSFPNGDLGSTVTPSSIGLNMPTVPTSTRNLLPQFSTNQYYGQVVGNSVNSDTYNTITFDNDWTKTLGNHTFHFGGELAEMQYANPGSVGNPNGTFSFQSENTQFNPLQRNTIPGVNDGFDVADMLLGYPHSGSVDFKDTLFEGNPTWALYGQDDWKITRKLTLNIGFRYDVQIGLRERYNRLNQGICFTCVNPISNNPVYQANLAADGPALTAAGLNPASLATVYGGFEFPGVKGNSRDAYNTDWTNMQPRFGFAYALNSKTVIRGGYGIFYTVGLEGGSNTGFSISTPYTNSTNGNVTPTNYFASGNPFPSGVQTPVGSSLGLETALGNGASVDFPGRRIPRSEEVSFGFQRELPGQIVLDARYSGNFTDRLRVFVWDNGTLTRAQLDQGVANPTLFNQQVPNPYYGVPGIPPSSKCGSNRTISRVTLLTPLSQYCDLIGQYNDPLGKQYYNGLEVKLNKRYSNGLSFQTSYTFSKTMQETGYQNGWPYQDASLKKQIAGSDRTHVLSVTGEWALPIGKGSKYVGTNASGVVGALINGWSANFIVSAQTGQPVGLNTGYYYNCNHSFTPDGGPTFNNYLYNNYSSGNKLGCWTTKPQFGLSVLPNQISTLRQPSIVNLDFAVHKDFAVRESMKLQFRAEALNMTNTVLFPGPDNNPGDGAPKLQKNGTYTGFGTVNLYQQNFPRIVQLTLKVLF
ncbi:MAG: carboxypeptidase regulatory-like domain-containing protein [Acidobacteriota bacterium]|nr:carboxypeptidase regulatory-like domain-containing protein [Acidobacteriota bacterium]